MKRLIGAVLSIFVSWNIIDFIIHGIILSSSYQETAKLWRPMEEMKMPLMYGVTLAFTICFVLIYGLVERKSIARGIMYGTLFGLATGISMGFGTYSYMPIPINLAWGWLAGTLVEMMVAGAIVGAIVKSG